MKCPWDFDEQEKTLAEMTDEELADERERIREKMALDIARESV